MNRKWRFVVLAPVLAIGLLVGCAQPATPATPAAEKPAGTTSAKPAEKPAEAATAKPAEKPAEKAAAKAAEPAAPAKTGETTIGIGSGTVGGGQHGVGVGVGKVMGDHTQIKVLVKPFAGPAAYMPMIESGELEMGVISGPDAGWAYNGTTGYDKPNRSLRMLMSGNLLPVSALVVRADSDIKAIKDLRGKRVTSEFGGNMSIRQNVIAALDSVGLTWNDLKPVPVADIASALRGLREGRADASFGGTPTHATTTEVDAAIGLRQLNFGDLPPDQASNAPKALVDKLQVYQPGAQVYLQKKEGWLKSEATAFRFPVLLVASAKANADVMYQVSKTLYQFDKELQTIHPWTKEWERATMFSASPAVPYHEGAIRFWKEIGKWTPEAEAAQKKLMGQ